MKNLITILLLSIALNSCSEEEIEPTPEPVPKELNDKFKLSLSLDDEMNTYTTGDETYFYVQIDDTLNYNNDSIVVSISSNKKGDLYYRANYESDYVPFDMEREEFNLTTQELDKFKFIPSEDGDQEILFTSHNSTRTVIDTLSFSSYKDSIRLHVLDYSKGVIDTLDMNYKTDDYDKLNVNTKNSNTAFKGYYQSEAKSLIGHYTGNISIDGSEIEISANYDVDTLSYGLNRFTIQTFEDNNRLAKSNIDTVDIFVKGYDIQGASVIGNDGDNEFRKGIKENNPNTFISIEKKYYKGDFFVSFDVYNTKTGKKVDDAFEFSIGDQIYKKGEDIRVSTDMISKDLMFSIMATGDIGEYHIIDHIKSEEGWEDNHSTNAAYITK